MKEDILKELKERLDIYDDGQKVISDINSEVNISKMNLEKIQQEFEQKFTEDKPNNPAYMDKKLTKKKDVDWAESLYNNANKKLEDKRQKVESEFKLGKEALKEKVERNRKILKVQYDLYKQPQKVDNMKQNIEDLKIQKEQMLNEIDEIKKEILHKQVIIKYFNTEYLDRKVESLNEKVSDIDNKINKQLEINKAFNIENLDKINFDYEFEKLDDIEQILSKPYTAENTVKELLEVYNKYEENKKDDKDTKEQKNKKDDKDTQEQENKKDDKDIKDKEDKKEGKSTQDKENKESKEVPKETTENKVCDFKFNNTNKGYYDKQWTETDNIESISMRISTNGVPIYTIQTKDGKKPEELYIKNIKDYKKILKDITINSNVSKKELKDLDPFLINIIGRNGMDDATSIHKILNKDINIKYDMANLNKLPFMPRHKFRKIARGAQNNEIEVENFKDVWYKEIAKKVRKFPHMLKEKEEPKKLNEAKKLKNKKELREKARKLKTKAILGYMSFDNKIGEKFTEVGDKLKNKILDIRDKNMIKSAEKAQARADKKYDKVYNRIAVQNQINRKIEYDKLGHRTTKTAEEEKIDKKIKEKSDEILKNIHLQQEKEAGK